MVPAAFRKVSATGAAVPGTPSILALPSYSTTPFGVCTSASMNVPVLTLRIRTRVTGEVAGTKTGKVFPTDNKIDYFDDVPVTCIDMAMPVVIIPAEYLGKTGYELPAELDADKALLARIESIRLQAGKAMGLGDVSNMVIPKPVLISPAQKGGAINVRYFMPHSCHRALAITGAIAISSSCALEGTITRQIVHSVGYGNINIEHPSGALDVHLSNEGQDATTLRASVIRTTRKIFSGEVYLP